MRFLMSTWGSRGDLHPFLSLGQALLRRGHQVSLAGPVTWREETESAQLRFVPTAEVPLATLFAHDPDIFSSRRGGLSSLRALIYRGLAPSLEPTLATLLEEAPGHDAILAHPFSYASEVAARLSGKPWITITLAPGIIPSSFSYPGPHYGRAEAHFLARQKQALVWSIGRQFISPIVDPPVNAFRARHRVPPARHFFTAGHSSLLNLQLYSSHFAPLPPDWTPEKRQGGFCYFDPAPIAQLSQETLDFLKRGPRPVLVTLGSAITLQAGNFFENASHALAQSGLRGIFLYGKEDNRPLLPASQLAVSYLPFGAILPHVCAAIHQGGIGTLAQTLRAGIPSLICPFAFDQPNNGRRAEALGVARVVLPGKRTPRDLRRALDELLHSRVVRQAAQRGEILRGEDGPARSCQLIEESLTDC